MINPLNPYPKALASLALILPLLTLWNAPAAQAAQLQLEYERIPALLRERSKALQGSAISIEASEARTGYLRGSYLPDVSALGGVEAFRTGPFATETQPFGALEASVNLYHGGRDSLEEQKRRTEVAHSRAAHEGLFRQELLAARSLYWDLVFQRQLASSLERSLIMVASGRAAADRRATRGLTTKTDARLFDLYSKQVQERIGSAKHEDTLIQIQLRSRLNVDATLALETPGESIPHAHDEKLMALSATTLSPTHPEVQALTEQSKGFEFSSRQLSRWWTPSVEAYGTYALYTLRDRTFPVLQDRIDVAGGVRVRLNLFDGLQSKREAESANLKVLSAEMESAARQQALSSDIQTTQGELKHLHELIHNSEETLKMGDSLLKQTIAEYDRGIRSSQDVLSGIERLVSLRELSLQRRRDYQKVKARLLALVGELGD